MNCPNCRQPVPDGASFCMACGRPLGAPNPATTGVVQDAFDAQRKKNRIVMGSLLGVGLITAVIAGLAMSGVLRLGAKTPDTGTLQAKGSVPSTGVLSAQGQTPPPVTPRVAERAVMPDDVRAWLLHLEKVEAGKVELTLRQQAELMKFSSMLSVLGSAMGSMNPYDLSEGDLQAPDQITMGKFADLKPDWEQLIAFFNSVPPPAECQPLAADYGRALGEIPGMTSDVVDLLNSVGQDPAAALAKVNTFKNKSYNEIDRYFLLADERLKAICDKYNERKWFNVKGDVVAGGSLGRVSIGSP